VSKVIVITGAGSGLGKTLARHFARNGDQVVLLGRTFAKLQTLAGEIGPAALPIACDVSDPDAVRSAFDQIMKTHGRVDVLINNAALAQFTTLGDASDDHIFTTVGTNLIGTLLCSRAALHVMAPGGHIINVSSESVDAPYPHHVVYQATKAGIETMSRHLQDEVRPRGIRISVVRAGPMLGEDRAVHSSPEASEAFHKACLERGMDLAQVPIARTESTLWVFQSLIDMPPDVHVDTVRFVGRKA
jgi:NAD(P)-dependent dehydrogenase (short-subunit alcohol dehydrogenase family)